MVLKEKKKKHDKSWLNLQSKRKAKNKEIEKVYKVIRSNVCNQFHSKYTLGQNALYKATIVS